MVDDSQPKQAADMNSTNHVCTISVHMLCHSRNWWGTYIELSVTECLRCLMTLVMVKAYRVFDWRGTSKPHGTSADLSMREEGPQKMSLE